MDPLTTLAQIPGIGPYLSYLIAAGVACAALSTILPPPASTGSIYARFYVGVNWLGLNFGHARNAGAPVQDKAPAAPPIAILVLVLMMLPLAGCLSPHQAAQAGQASSVALDLASSVAPGAVAKFDAACPKLQAAAKSAADVAAFAGVPATAQQQIAQDQALLAGSCTEAGKQQLAANDAAPPGPANSGDSLGWMNTVLTDALAVAKVASVVVPLL